MKITMIASSAMQEILSAELRSEIISTAVPLGVEFEEHKGLTSEIIIAIVSQLAADLLSKLLLTFSNKHKVKIKIEEGDKTICISYKGDDYSKIKEFLLETIK